MFCLFYDAKSKQVKALNGSGRSASGATLDKIRDKLNDGNGEVEKIPGTSVLAVTVPGAAAGWVDTIEKFGSGKVTLNDVLTPAIELAEEGFAVSEISSYHVGLRTRLPGLFPN